MRGDGFIVEIGSVEKSLRIGPSHHHALCVPLSDRGANGVDIVPASVVFERRAPARCRMLLLRFTPRYAMTVAHSIGATMPVRFTDAIPDVRDARILHAALALAEISFDDNRNGMAIASALTRAIVEQVVRKCSPPQFSGKLEEGCLAIVLQHIEANLQNDLAVPVLARLANMTETRFRELVRRRLGMTPYQYILRRRTDRAVRMLCSSNASLRDVAAACGFSNPSHLARGLRNGIGVSPIEFRR